MRRTPVSDSIGSELEYLWFASADVDSVEGQPIASSEESDAVVADIFHLDVQLPRARDRMVDPIYVIVPLGDGRFELAVGGVSSYYEFRRPTTELRLTDEEWRAMLVKEPMPVDRPSWQAPFLVGATTSPDPIPTQTVPT